MKLYEIEGKNQNSEIWLSKEDSFTQGHFADLGKFVHLSCFYDL